MIVVAAVAAAATWVMVWPRRPPVSRISPSTTVRPVVVVLVAAGVLAGIGLESPTVVAGALTIPAVVVDHRRRLACRRAEELHRADVLAWLEGVERAVRHGAGLSGALADSFDGVEADDWRAPIARSLAAGEPLSVALRAGAASTDAPTRSPPSVRAAEQTMIVVTLEVLAVSGGAALAALQRVGDALRHRNAAADDRQTQAQQARSSAALMAGLPVLFVVGAAAVDRRLIDVYLSTPIGAGCLGFGAAATWVGWRWTDHIVERSS